MNVQILRQLKVKTVPVFFGLVFLLWHLPLATGVTALPIHPLQQEISLIEAIHHISEKYQVLFNYDRAIISDIRVQYEPRASHGVDEAISAVLVNTNLKYQMFNQRYVVIYKNDQEGIESLKEMIHHFQKIVDDKDQEMLVRQQVKPTRRLISSLPQDLLQSKSILFTIEGNVVDQGGEPLIGVNIQVKGTNKGTATDFEGHFSLEDVDENAVLVISYIGYQTQEVPAGGKSNLDITLFSGSQLLDEVVVVGYGKKRKENLTAAVDMVDTDILKNRPVQSVGEMLAGAIPNLNVSLSSGAPDATPSFNIRGFTGFGSLGSPLILVDGVEQDINTINPNDVETISVLKGAAASAIYGSRAPNGIILINTKSGKKGTPMRVNYSVNYNVNTPYKLPSTMKSVTYAKYQNMSFNNSQAEAYYTDETIQAMQDYIDGNGPNNSKRPDGRWKEHVDAHGNTDYYDVAFKDNSSNMFHNLSLDGGSDNTTYYMGIGYTTKEGVYESKIDDYDRFSTILKVNSDVTDWFNVGLNTRFSRIKTTRPNFNFRRNDESRLSGESSDNSFLGWIAYFPNIPVKNPDGSYHRLSALPLLDGLQGKISNTSNDLWVTPYVEINPLKGLKVKSSFSWNSGNQDVFESIFQVFVVSGDGSLIPSARSATYDGIIQNTFKNEYYQFDSYIEYETDFQNHNFSFLTGFQQEFNKFNNLRAERRGLYNTALPTFSTAYGDQMNSDRLYEWATRGLYFRGSYNFKDKYLVDFNGRYDASSKFSSQKRWALFPSLSAGYNIAKESFWPLKEKVEMFKITAQWGKSGNHGTGTGNGDLYTYLPTMGTGTTSNILEGNLLPYVSIPPLLSNDLTWAKPRTIGFGIETGLFDNRLYAEYRWYQRTVFDQFSPPEILPEVLGTAVPRANNGVSETRGWETSVSWSDQAFTVNGSPLFYKVRAILSDYIGYVVTYQSNENGLRSGWTPGQEFGVLYGYESIGLAPDENFLASNVPDGNGWYYPGDLYFKDVDGDGQINNGQGNRWYTQGDRQNLGNTYPRYKYSVYLGTSWKNLDLSILFDGVGQQVSYVNNYQALGFVAGGWSGRTALSVHEELGGYWSKDNQDAFFPRPYQNTKSTNSVNDQYILDLGHLLIKNINLSYSIPHNLLEKIRMDTARINFSIENVGIIYNKSWLNFHPDDLVNGLRSYPVQKIFSVGINVGI